MVTYNKKDFHNPEHILNKMSAKERQDLESFVLELIDEGSGALSRTRADMEGIAQEINGVVELSETDKQIWREWKEGNPVAPAPVNPQMTKSHLADAVTFLMTTLAAEPGIWTAFAEPDKQSKANALADRMTQDADNFNHYGEIEAAFNNGIRYNLGGVFCEWVDKPTITIQPSETGTGVNQAFDTLSGNRLRSFDPYNFFCDTTCAPHELGDKGEYAGEFTLVPRREVYAKLVNGIWTLPEDAEDYDVYNRKHTAFTNYRTMKGTADYEVSYSSSSEEVDTVYINLYPALWGLPLFDGEDENTAVTWRFDCIPDYGLVGAERIGITGLPIAAWEVDKTLLFDCSGSIATQLLPFQRFISYIFSGYQRGLMKNINGGFTLFDEQRVDMKKISSAALLGGVVPVNPGVENGLNGAFVNIQPSVDLSHIQQDIGLALDLMQRIFPTDTLKQVADLERATQYQAAATVQASNRRNLMIAKSIDSMMMAPLRKMQVQNILLNVDSLSCFGSDGIQREEPISSFADIKLQYSVKNGLSGLDKLGISSALMSAIDRVIQSNVAAQEFDMMKALTYYMQLNGSKIDFNAFIKVAPQLPTPAGGSLPPLPAGAGGLEAGNPLTGAPTADVNAAAGSAEAQLAAALQNV